MQLRPSLRAFMTTRRTKPPPLREEATGAELPGRRPEDPAVLPGCRRTDAARPLLGACPSTSSLTSEGMVVAGHCRPLSAPLRRLSDDPATAREVRAADRLRRLGRQSCRSRDHSAPSWPFPQWSAPRPARAPPCTPKRRSRARAKHGCCVGSLDLSRVNRPQTEAGFGGVQGVSDGSAQSPRLSRLRSRGTVAVRGCGAPCGVQSIDSPLCMPPLQRLSIRSGIPPPCLH